MSVYPKSIEKAAFSPRRIGCAVRGDASAREASLVCGCFISIALEINSESGCIDNTACRTNGCGYLIAFAEEITEAMIGRSLSSLTETVRRQIYDLVNEAFGCFPASRMHCLEIVERSISTALAAYRTRIIDEYRGDDVLICTCFGVSEATVEACIRDNSLSDVDQVADVCRAGGGCGSCQFLISEMLDLSRREAA
ncbi:MAG: iron-sulfur cluster assembly scaffold protein [Pyrinomonadaceae bacterium]